MCLNTTLSTTCRIRSLTGIAACAIALFTHAQQIAITPIPADSAYYLPLPKPFLDSYIYFQGGLAIPMGLFGKLPESSATVMDPFRGNTGTGAVMGYLFEMGYRRAFVVDHAASTRLYPFWGVAIGGTYNALDWTGLGGYWKQQARSEIAQGAGTIHLGAALKRRWWALEGHAGLVLPAVTYYPDNNIEGSADRPTDFSLRVVEGSADWSPGFTAGLTWRSRHFRIGAEWFRHRSTVTYTYRERSQPTATHLGLFDWQLARAYLGFQF